ncbi:MAG TPA: DUF4252 domain-containing protein [Steroidobacteraceae bacterium]|nr:DUF4252 domain-containing protein [Steroidobacteraceae bacterium]
MRYRCLVLSLCLLAAPLSALAQAGRVQLPPDLDRLAKRAIDSVVVSLDGNMLRMGKQFMQSDGDAQASAVAEGLQGVYVRSFKFAHDHEYSASDVSLIVQQLSGAGWVPMISVHKTSTDENVEICVHRDNHRVQGMVIFVAKPRELTLVNLVGNIDLTKLGELRGQFGVPSVPDLPLGGSAPAPAAH